MPQPKMYITADIVNHNCLKYSFIQGKQALIYNKCTKGRMNNSFNLL